MQKSKSDLDIYLFCPRCSKNLVSKTIDKSVVKACENCGFIFWNNPIAVVSLLLHQDNKILMLQRANQPFKNSWVLPGGFMNIDETSEDAIKREVKEETGLNVNVDGIIGVYRIDNDPRGIHIDIIYHGKLNGQTPTVSKEATNWFLFSKDELPKDIAYKHKNAIIDWVTKKGQY